MPGREGMVVIAISGLHGAGKTTAARALARKFGLKYVSAGTVFRQMAKEKGMTLDRFSQYVERHPGIDSQIDSRTANVAKKDGVLIDARLSGWMAKGADIRILLTAPLELRVKRIARRERRRFKDVLAETESRERSEARRFKRLYGIDVNDYSGFDIMLNTDRWSVKEMNRILEIVVEFVIKGRV
jgi:cytidylate kinase